MSDASKANRARILILGAGPGGICTGIKLREAGIEDFIILEREHEAGGTWVNNRYPGLACDVPSLMYSFTFEQKPDWTRAYARQPEIKAYMQGCVDKYDLARHIVFGTSVTRASWDDDRSEWTLHASDGRVFIAPIFISALGMFNQPRWPDIPGLADFEGRTLHTAAWPQDVDLAGRRVAVIGTAASAVQLLPEVAPVVDQLFVFQRTPNWVFPKEDPIHSAEELESLRNDPARVLALRGDTHALLEDLLTFDQPATLEALRKSADELRQAVNDPELREKMRPTVPLGSQRPLFSNDYYPCFNRDNVTLVTDPIERITATGVTCASSRHVDVDTLVLATGYAANRFLSVIDVEGRAGRSLKDAWSDGPQAYLGITTAGFPNLFMLYGPNTNNGSILYMLERQVDYILDKLTMMQAAGATSIDVRGDVMDRYNAALQAHLLTTIWGHEGSKYYRSASGRIVTQWPWNMAAFEQRLAAPDPDAFELRGGADTQDRRSRSEPAAARAA